MSLWGWTSVAFVLAVVALAVWALAHQRRMFPSSRVRVGEPEERRPELRWIAWIYGGGHG
jgi:hypothetical protein